MRKILVVGAGQSGLQLALGLQSHGYEVTLMSNRTADEIRSGRSRARVRERTSVPVGLTAAARTQALARVERFAGR